jgi:hypothetical protein
MAGRDERKRILGQLKARQATLSRRAVAGTTASVGEPADWPVDSERPTLDGTYSRSSEPTRITIRETGDGLGIHVPTVKQIFVILFMLVWLTGWAVGEWFALSEIASGGINAGTIFLVFWVSIWTLGGGAVIFAIGWQLFGSERMFVTAGAVVTDWGFGPFRRKTVWAPGEATKFRKATSTLRKGRLVPGRGIAFEAGGDTRTFGSTMTEQEIVMVLAAIGRHLPGALLEHRERRKE